MTNNTPKETSQHPTFLKLLTKTFFGYEFVLGALVPIGIYSIFNKMGNVLQGVIVAISWGILVTAAQYIIKRTISVVAALAVIFGIITLIITICTKNPSFYLIAPIIGNCLYFIVFIGSLCIGKPLIRVIAESMSKFPEEFRKTEMYKKPWKILTLLWGMLNIVEALLKTGVLLMFSAEVYLLFKALFGNITFVAMMVFSFWYPNWYWKKNNVAIS